MRQAFRAEVPTCATDSDQMVGARDERCNFPTILEVEGDLNVGNTSQCRIALTLAHELSAVAIREQTNCWEVRWIPQSATAYR